MSAILRKQFNFDWKQIRVRDLLEAKSRKYKRILVFEVKGLENYSKFWENGINNDHMQVKRCIFQKGT